MRVVYRAGMFAEQAKLSAHRKYQNIVRDDDLAGGVNPRPYVVAFHPSEPGGTRLSCDIPRSQFRRRPLAQGMQRDRVAAGYRVSDAHREFVRPTGSSMIRLPKAAVIQLGMVCQRIKPALRTFCTHYRTATLPTKPEIHRLQGRVRGRRDVCKKRAATVTSSCTTGAQYRLSPHTQPISREVASPLHC